MDLGMDLGTARTARTRLARAGRNATPWSLCCLEMLSLCAGPWHESLVQPGLWSALGGTVRLLAQAAVQDQPSGQPAYHVWSYSSA
jgi:hypothetical protein